MVEGRNDTSEIGVVLGSKPATPVDFYVAVGRDKVLQLDDVVFTYVDLKTNKTSGVSVSFYGIVDSIERSYEGLDFDSDMYYIDSVRVEERHVAHVKITRIEPEYFIPPRPGNPVFLASGKESYEYQKAIGADKMAEKIPAGFSTTGQKIFIDLEFVNGKKGAHINISGISGVATKTTYGIFLLHEIMRYAKNQKENYVGIIFNVKGEDLLFMDKPNKKIYEEKGEKYIDEWKELSEEYESIIRQKKGLSSFKIRFCAPKRKGKGLVPDVNQRNVGDFKIFGWSAYSFSKHGIMRYAISEEDNDNVKSLIEDISDVMRVLAEYAEDSKKNYIFSPFGQNEKRIETYDDIKDFVNDILFSEKRPIIAGELEKKISDIRNKNNYSIPTKKACKNRIHRISKIGDLINPEFGNSQDTLDLGSLNLGVGEIYLFHITPLEDICQRIVVGSILSKIFKQQEEEGSGQRKVIVFLDELSKYAPREGFSPIKEVLEDIAERGRSLGVILIGAEQSARTVSRKIIMNSSIKIVGRMSSEEIESSEYGFLTRELKMRLLASQPGNMVLNQPNIYVPIMVRFPFPFWATRKEEVLENSENYQEKIKETLGDLEG